MPPDQKNVRLYGREWGATSFPGFFPWLLGEANGEDLGTSLSMDDRLPDVKMWQITRYKRLVRTASLDNGKNEETNELVLYFVELFGLTGNTKSKLLERPFIV